MIFSDIIEIETVLLVLLTLGRICTSPQKLSIGKNLKILFLTFFYLSRDQLLQEISTDLQTELNSWI